MKADISYVTSSQHTQIRTIQSLEEININLIQTNPYTYLFFWLLTSMRGACRLMLLPWLPSPANSFNVAAAALRQKSVFKPTGGELAVSC